jgi:hypothetical protein
MEHLNSDVFCEASSGSNSFNCQLLIDEKLVSSYSLLRND